MFSLLRSSKPTTKCGRGRVELRKLRFDILEDRRLLALAMAGVPIDLGVVPGFKEMIPLGINDAGKVFGALDHGPYEEGPRHTFVYSNGVLHDLGAPLKGLLGEDLPQLCGVAMNEQGIVVGYSDDNTNYRIAQHAFRATGPTDVQDLGHLGGGPAVATAIDKNSGRIVGHSLNGSWLTRAFVWEGGQPKDLGQLDFTRPDTSAEGVAGNLIVGDGWSRTPTGAYGQRPHAFLLRYDPLHPNGIGEMQDLGALDYDESHAKGVIDQPTPVVFGELWNVNEQNEPIIVHGFYYKDGVMRDMGTLGGKFSYPKGINAQGVVFGTSTNAKGNDHAFIYDGTRMRDLGVLGTVDHSWANGINDAGQVVGGSYAAGHPRMHAFVYDSGKMIDLNKLLPANSGWELQGAFDINNRGQIVGIGIHNGKSRAFLATITSKDTVGPLTSDVVVAPTPANAPPEIRATIDDTGTGGNNIVAAEYFIGVRGTRGYGRPMDAAFDSATQTVTATLPAAAFNGLKQGKHTIFVHGKDAAGNWGRLVPATFVKDTLGPVSSGVKVSPSPTNTAPTLTATLDDKMKGGSLVAAAEYFIDARGENGAGVPIDATFDKVTQTVTAALDPQTFDGLAAGKHQVYVHGRDALGNWGALVAASFVKDTAGPATSHVNVSPSPAKKAPTVMATIDDTASGRSNIVAAEYFIDALGGPGAGTPMSATDRKYNSRKENVRAVISSQVFAGLGAGEHIVYVRGKDAAGNWGAAQQAIFVKTASSSVAASLAAAWSSSSSKRASSLRANDAAILAVLPDSPLKRRGEHSETNGILLDFPI